MASKLNSNLLVAGGVVLALGALFFTFRTRLINSLSAFIPSVEGFSAHPYWDVSRYSWGYGTAAPGSTGTITREQAFVSMISYLMADYSTLKPKITRRLTIGQWTALLSFSYNLGVGNALKLLPYINSGNFVELGVHWLQYVYADGTISQTLVDRRKKEWARWNS